MAELVTAEEYRIYVGRAYCGCGHDAAEHIGHDRPCRAPGCGCTLSYRQVNLDALERLVRVKMADELDAVAAKLRRGDPDDSLSDGWTTMYAKQIEERAEEVRNG